MTFVFTRILATLLSLLILGAAGYLAWSWYQGEWARTSGGDLVRLREDWRLWTATALFAWSFLGRLAVAPLLARPDRNDDERLHLSRSNGQHVAGESGADLYVELHGLLGTQPIVFTHGWGLDSRIWDFAKRELSKSHRLILWDLPGLGRSRAKRIDLDAFAADLRSVIGLCGDQKPILVGHSIGGMTIQTLARNDPDFVRERIAGIVLLNTTCTRPQETMILSGLFKLLRWPLVEPLLRVTIWLAPLAWLSAWQGYLSGWSHLANRLGFSRSVTRSQLEKTTLLQTKNSPASQAKGDLAMMRWDGREGAARMSSPALIIGGAKDIVTLPRASEMIHRLAPSAELKIVSEANHMGMVDMANTYVSAIRDFISEMQRPAQARTAAE